MALYRCVSTGYGVHAEEEDSAMVLLGCGRCQAKRCLGLRVVG